MNLKHMALILMLFMCFNAYVSPKGARQSDSETPEWFTKSQSELRSDLRSDLQADLQAAFQANFDKLDNRLEQLSASIPEQDNNQDDEQSTNEVDNQVPPDNDQQQASVATDAKFVPVDREIVNILQILRNAGKELNGLKFSLSMPVSLTISEQNNASRFDINDGALVSSETTPRKIQFDTDAIGTLRAFIPNAPEGMEIFVIDFQSGTDIISFGFKRNTQRDNFVLFSAVYGTKRYNIRYRNDPPYLNIFTDITRSSGTNEIQAAPVSSPGNIQQSGVQNTNTRLSGRGRSKDIMGHSSVTKGGIIAYAESQNSTVNSGILNNLIDTYVKEADFEGINLDIAIAQMLYATNFLKNQQRMSTYNYAGLSINDTEWNGKFRNMTEGVQAHIQHLKNYASTDLNGQEIDPRHQILASLDYRGKITMFDELYKVWTDNSASYENEINKVLDDLYRFSDN